MIRIDTAVDGRHIQTRYFSTESLIRNRKKLGLPDEKVFEIIESPVGIRFCFVVGWYDTVGLLIVHSIQKVIGDKYLLLGEK